MDGRTDQQTGTPRALPNGAAFGPSEGIVVHDGAYYLTAWCVLEPAASCWVARILRCPRCGKEHTHAAGSLTGEPRSMLGHRVPHCDPADVGADDEYWLVAIDHPASTPTALGFASWLRDQRDRDDPVGDLARDTERVGDWYNFEVTELSAIEGYLAAHGACDGAFDALRQSWWEWRQCRALAPDAGRVVYFVQVGLHGPIKIGRTAKVGERLSGLQTANPEPLRLLASVPGGPALERVFHTQLTAHHIRGEWFRAHPDVLRLVDELRGSR